MKGPCIVAVMLAAVSAFVDPAGAQVATPAHTIHIAAPQFIALSVPDLEASERWYSELFGLRRMFRDVAPDSSVRVLLLASPQLRVELASFRAARPLEAIAGKPTPREMVHGIVKFGVFVSSIEKTIATLREHGASIEGQWLTRPAHITASDSVWTPNILVRDNSGNFVQFFEARH